MITASNNINVNLVQGGAIDSCLYNIDSLILVSSGAATYIWSMESNSNQYFYFSKILGDTAIVKINNISAIKSSINLSVKVIGDHGTCTDSATLIVSLLKQENDSIENAIPLNIGANGPFNNYCSSIQAGEPVPPHSSCTGQMSWCDQYGTGLNIVQNSVWFTFKPGQTGYSTLSSNGMDNAMALYDAASAQDILNNVPLKAGKTYWIQVGGSGGGSEGVFTITIGNITATSINGTNFSEALSIFPQPAQSIVNIRSDGFIGKTFDLAIYSVTGNLVYDEHFTNNADNSIKVNTEKWTSGLYFARVVSDGNLYLGKILKK
jgi:hypothetical protein